MHLLDVVGNDNIPNANNRTVHHKSLHCLRNGLDVDYIIFDYIFGNKFSNDIQF